jgi:hypothetical protein
VISRRSTLDARMTILGNVRAPYQRLAPISA